jgi:class 3 adenylate cyclase
MTVNSPTGTPAPMTGAILFTDLVGFTEFNGVAGDLRALEVLETQTAMVSAAIARCDSARLVKELGDGLMLWFDDAAVALECTLALMATVEAARAAGGFPLAMRLGLHHGPVLARGDDLVGQSVNIAARVCEFAGPGELLVSDAVIEQAGMVPDDVDPVGPARVKGVDGPIWLHRVSA